MLYEVITLLLDHPVIMRALARAGREMNVGGLGAVNETERETLTTQIEDFRKQAREALRAGDHEKADRLSAKERELIIKRDGNKSIAA